MNNLAEMKCDVCRVGGATASDNETIALLAQVPDWQVIKNNGTKRLIRVFKFTNFREALDFTNKVGEIAESEGHHPEITTEWGKVTVQWWTHKIKGLHENDFGMAAKTDLLMK